MTLKELKTRKNWGKNIHCIIRNLCGKKIGSGAFRDVYELKGNPRYVVKIERDPSGGNFCNACEWRHWIDNQGWKNLTNWLCPCIMISETGQTLIQKRVRHKSPKAYPKKIPNVFTDTKYTNAGWLGNKFVFCDYPYLRIASLRLRKANWWSNNPS